MVASVSEKSNHNSAAAVPVKGLLIVGVKTSEHWEIQHLCHENFIELKMMKSSSLLAHICKESGLKKKSPKNLFQIKYQIELYYYIITKVQCTGEGET